MLETVSSRLVTAWSATGLPLALINETMPTSDEWAALTIRVTDARQRTSGAVGQRRIQRTGWILVKVATPAGHGVSRLSALARVVTDALETVDMPAPEGGEPVNTQASPGIGAPVTDGRWVMAVVSIPFWYSETK